MPILAIAKIGLGKAETNSASPLGKLAVLIYHVQNRFAMMKESKVVQIKQRNTFSDIGLVQ